MKLTNILKEIVVRRGNILSSEDLKNIDIVFEFFGEGNSGFDLHEPIIEQRDIGNYGEDSGPNGEFEFHEDEENYPEYQAFKALLKKPNGTYVGPDINHMFLCPGAPANAFYSRLDVNYSNTSLLLYEPYIDELGTYYVGWFDASGKYHADTTHFDEDGNRIA